jgi:hypothetical protein
MSGRGVGDVEHTNVVAARRQRSSELLTVHLRSLRGKRRELVDDLQDAHGAFIVAG